MFRNSVETHFVFHRANFYPSALALAGVVQTFPKQSIEEVVYGLVREYRGSVSAEHGIGTLKKPWLGHARSVEEIALMRTLKNALDPRGVLNPGKVI